jgi:hypothetical protein
MTNITEKQQKWIEFLESNQSQSLIDLVKYHIYRYIKTVNILLILIND